MSDLSSFETCKYIEKGSWRYLLNSDNTNSQGPASIKVADFPKKPPLKQPSENTPDKKHHKSNAIIIYTLIAAAAGYIVFRGFSYGPVARWAERTVNMLDDKAYDLMTNNKSLNTIQRAYLGIVQKIKHGLQKFNALSNITAIKDSSLQKAGTYKGLGWIKTISKKITNLFKRIVRSAYDGVYKKSMGVIDTNSANISNTLNDIAKNLSPERLQQKLSINGVEKTVEEWLKIAQINAHSITPDFQKGFSALARGRRIQRFDRATANFDEIIFSKLKTMKQMIHDGTYITEKTSRPFTQEGLSEISKIKDGISQNIDDITNFALDNLSRVKSEISPKDSVARGMIRMLQKEIKKYHSLPSTAETAQRQKLTENISSMIGELTERLTQKGDVETIKTLNSILDKLTVSNQKGHLENILTIVRAIEGKNSNSYTNVIIPSARIRNALNDMVKIESSLYNKFAELNTGSAPTDILGLAVPTATGIYLVSKGENRQKRISSTLKQGIPILGGILTCLYCTLKMKTGLYGLALGATASYILNQIGSKINNLYQKRIEDNKFKSAAVEYYMKNYVNAKKS